MRVFLISFVLIAAAAIGGCAAQATEASIPSDRVSVVPVQTDRKPVLVELFTSEGCSSCPPAEALLAKYESEQPFSDVQLVTLAFHVDYWDDLGWKDPYASAIFTQRQKIYDRKFRTGKIYTPQMVVDGDIEFVGSREKDAAKAFGKATKNNKGNVILSIDGKKLQINITRLGAHEDASVFVAIAEDNLSSNVLRGENTGKNLKHVGVVRSMVPVGSISAGIDSYESVFDLQIDPSWNEKHLKIVVFVQENTGRNVIGVTQEQFLNRVSDNDELLD